MTPKIVDKSEKMNKIAEAAAQVFVQKGFSKATIIEIARAAGIGKGTIYEYFSSKEEIIHYLFNYFNQRFDLNFAVILNASSTADKKIESLINAFSAFLSPENRPLVRLIFHLWAEAMKERETENIIKTELSKIIKTYKEVIVGLVEEGKASGIFFSETDSPAVALILVSIMDELMFLAAMGEEIDYQRELRSVLDLVLKGIVKR